ncbi:MAG: OmpH family outer membrane protein [Chitinophagaceae bacterium]|nr:OmpH family outer membrane protein [Chitinophagaceae bacterium]MCW5926113.1 OmpH family outer membrane protein [Chitinophagaceae bacterium]
MKYLSLVLSVVALILSGILLYQQKSSKEIVKGISNKLETNDSVEVKPIRIAYVDLDSMDARFEYYKVKMEAFEKKKEGLDRQLNNSYQNLDNKRIEFLRKGNAITQAEADAFKREYDQQLQYLENQRRKTEQDVQQEAMVMRDDIFSKINEYLEEYSRVKGYTYIFSYSRNANVFLYQDEANNITDEVINGLNDRFPKPAEKKK